MVGVGGCSSHIDWIGVVVEGVKTSFCSSNIGTRYLQVIVIGENKGLSVAGWIIRK